MKNQNTFVALYKSHDLAEDAVKKLQKASYDMKKLSIVGQDYHTEESVIGYYNLGDRARKWGGAGAFWGGMWGLLFGSAFFFLPGLGPVVIAGPLIASLVAALEGAIVVGGLTALGAALYSLGIPKNSILTYETELKAGKFILVAHGNDDEVENARNILGISQEIPETALV
ncbi:general stress protein [Spirosoma spitsbergense]|uniref:general stress protein n=1 Tax=Spirosoma spitsbergense TaxID=431554 RepID=UPI0003651880|nr:general stress protein [Spirosoma spitsbergense]